MKSAVIALTLFWASLVACFDRTHAAKQWENAHYSRTIDLSKSFVKETDLIEIKNLGSTPCDEYFFSLNDGFGAAENVSVVSVTLIDNSFNLEPELVGDKIYRLALPYPVAPNSVFELRVNYVYTSGLVTVPAKLNMDEKQQILLKLNKFPYSAYGTSEYSLRFIGISKGQEMELLDEDKTNVTKNVIDLRPRVEEKALVYGPTIGAIEPWTLQPMGLLYDHNFPLTHVINLNRSMWIPASDVAQVPVEEYYELTNSGAELKGGFSRIDWMKGRFEQTRNHWALSHMEILGNDNQFDDYYFTDKVGMVSTHQKVKGHLVLQPRFPVFGGWKYNFTLGWNNDVSQYIHKVDDEEDTYVAKFPLLNGLRDATYKTVYLSFYLPEDAELVNIASPVEFSELIVENEMSYLDVSNGHVKVTAKYENLFDDLHKVDVLIKYRYTKASYFWKVAKISGFVFVGLMSYYLLSLIDISVEKEQEKK